jgi:hypothetical protein
MLIPFLPSTPSKTSNVRPYSALTEIKGIAGRHPTERTETKRRKVARWRRNTVTGATQNQDIW